MGKANDSSTRSKARSVGQIDSGASKNLIEYNAPGCSTKEIRHLQEGSRFLCNGLGKRDRDNRPFSILFS